MGKGTCKETRRWGCTHLHHPRTRGAAPARSPAARYLAAARTPPTERRTAENTGKVFGERRYRAKNPAFRIAIRERMPAPACCRDIKTA